MEPTGNSPRFGTADLSNCERELIHLPGSIQPHGALLVLREPGFRILQASRNVEQHLGIPVESILDEALERVVPDLARALDGLTDEGLREIRHPITVEIEREGVPRPYLGLVHRHPTDGLFVELEPMDKLPPIDDRAHFLARANAALGRIAAAGELSDLTAVLARTVRSLTGYDRVMVYRFDRDGHGEVVAEEVDPALDSFLGLHYPASDIPRRARRLYERNRLRILVDTGYEPVPIVPRFSPLTGQDLDMSLCTLRSVSPIHVQFLNNMAVSGTLVTSLIADGELWGLVACHHYSTKNLPYEARAVCELISEVASSRIAVIEDRVRLAAEHQVRQLEERLIEAASRDGDWRPALFREPATLLEPLGASGAALFLDGEIDTVGEVPSTMDLRRLRRHVARAGEGSLFLTRSLSREHTELADLSPTVAGVLAVELSASGREFLMWFRPEQAESVRWAGDPRKPMIIGDDPADLSPRRSFAVWTELVRGTSHAWEDREVALARVLGESLRDMISQVRSMRLLLAEREATRLRRSLHSASQPLIVASADGRILFENEAFSAMFERPHVHLQTLEDLPSVFADPNRVRRLLRGLLDDFVPWHGELGLLARSDHEVPVAVRMDPIPSRFGTPVGYVLIFTDLTEWKRTETARRELYRTVEGSFAVSPDGVDGGAGWRFHQAIASALAGAADSVGTVGASGSESLVDLGVSARRAALLSRQLVEFTERRERRQQRG